MRGKAVTVLVTLTLVLSAPVALAATGGHTQSTEAGDGAHRSIAQENSTNNSSVTVGVGQQLSTVVVETDSDVRTDVEESNLESALADANASARAKYLSTRADALTDRAERLQAAYQDVTRAYLAEELSRDAYAQRLASLNARAENVQASIVQTRALAQDVSALELRAAGYSDLELRTALHSLDVLTGAGITELRQRFTGQEEDGDIELEQDDEGLSVSISSDVGDVTREIERSRDSNQSFAISQSDALQTARSALGMPDSGTWALERSSVAHADGSYVFTFALTRTSATGSASVAVDGSSGGVYSLTAVIETPGGDVGDSDESGDSDSEDGESADGDAADDDADDGESGGTESESQSGGLTVLLADGSLEGGSQITILATNGSTPVSGASVFVNGQPVGTTSADGTYSLTVPEEDATIRVSKQQASGTLEIDVAEDEDEELASNLAASASTSNGQVTVSVTYDGVGISGATVFANGQQVGTTDAAGRLTLDATTSSLDVTVVKGEFEATFTFTEQNGSYTHTSTTVGDAEEDDGDSEDGDDSDGDGSDADGTDRDSTEGDSTDGDSTDGDTTDGDATDGDSESTSDGDSGTDSDGSTTTASSSDGDTEQVDSDDTDGD